jgi:serine protease Do
MKLTSKKTSRVAIGLLVCLAAGGLEATQSNVKAATPAVSGLVDLTQAAESSVNGVVYIKVTTNGKTQTVDVQDPFSDFFGDFFGRDFGGGGTQKRQIQTPKRQAAGSGVIISKDGYIVTNNHVVKDADVVEVKLNDNREFKARIIGTDETTDLALIKIEGKDLTALPIGNSDNLKLGEWVLAVGNPFNLTSTVTAGIVSAKARTLSVNGIESFIQTDAAINAGNSGGALVNARGELVGINAMLYSQTGSYSGYGFAIPTSIMNKVVADLKTYGVVQRAVLGISGSTVSEYIDSQKDKDNADIDLGTVNGVYIASVTDGGTADEAGLKKGDVITAVDGKKVNKMSELQEILTKHNPGDVINITYMRDKKEASKKITLKNAKGTTKVVKEVDADVLGAAFRPVSESLKKQFNITYGLEVASLSDGKLKEAGLKKGFIILKINDEAIKSVDDLQAAVKEANSHKDQTLWIVGLTSTGKESRIGVYLGE